MASRLELSEKLRQIVENVYFQPTANTKLKYPCIVYKLDDIYSVYADDEQYQSVNKYHLTLIDKNPDSEYVGSISKLRHCRFAGYHAADNLNHYRFVIYF